MNLEDVIDPEYGLQQDEWSLSKPTFGEDGQLEGQLTVVGWSGRQGNGIRYYILKCIKCSQDNELFGEGYFRSTKSNLVNGTVPCGCSRNSRWSQEQYTVTCSRKAREFGYTFIGFVGEWKGAYTKIKLSCRKHGEWSSGNVSNLINHRHGCPECGAEATIKAVREANTKSDDVMIASFFASGAFHPKTQFWRSDRLDSESKKKYWYISCPECGEQGESKSSNLQLGQRPCACSKQRQKECYINWLIDNKNMAVAIKFGIANNSNRRVKQQDTKSLYEVRQYQVYSFPSVQACKQAERECKKELETGVVLKRDMPDGYSETTWAFNVGKVKDIYERNGGVLV